ncbi:MAG: hypothetical protein HS114_19070 [Anaerolineales bacterium]|nr:hypothetical protein [Anaerolineales bacterium]
MTSPLAANYAAGTHYGFRTRDANEGGGNEQQLHSREKGESIPQLVVSFVPAPTPVLPFE